MSIYASTIQYQRTFPQRLHGTLNNGNQARRTAQKVLFLLFLLLLPCSVAGAQHKLVARPAGAPSELRLQLWPSSYSAPVGGSINLYARVSHASRLYVFYKDASGRTRLVFPNYLDQDNQLRPHHTMRIPTNPHYILEIAPPPGKGTFITYAVRSEFASEETIRNPFNPFDFHHANQFVPSARIAMRRILTNRSLYGRDYVIDTTPIRAKSPYREPAPVGQGRLVVTTSPTDAVVYLDGQYMGRTPLSVPHLTQGRYHLYIYKDGYEVEERDLFYDSVGDTKRLSIRLQRPGTR